MKTHRLIIALTTLLLTAVPSQSSAADVSVDIVSIAPRNHDAVIAQIELNVLLKQYEKLLTQIEDAILQRELENESIPSDATEDHKKQAKERHVKQNTDYERTLSTLQIRAHDCRRRIVDIMSEANKRSAAFEKEQREAMKAAGQSLPNVGTLTLRGKSGDGNGGTVTVTTGQNSLTATMKDEGKAPQSGTLIFSGDSNKGTTPPKAPRAGTVDLNGPLTLKGSNEYTNPTNVPANVQPTPAK